MDHTGRSFDNEGRSKTLGRPQVRHGPGLLVAGIAGNRRERRWNARSKSNFKGVERQRKTQSPRLDVRLLASPTFIERLRLPAWLEGAQLRGFPPSEKATGDFFEGTIEPDFFDVHADVAIQSKCQEHQAVRMGNIEAQPGILVRGSQGWFAMGVQLQIDGLWGTIEIPAEKRAERAPGDGALNPMARLQKSIGAGPFCVV